MACSSILKPLWTAATTQSSSASTSSEMSSRPFLRMSHSVPASTRISGCSSSTRLTSVICFMSRSSSRPLAMARVFVWSVMAMYSKPIWAVFSAISAMDAWPSLQSVCTWRSPRTSSRVTSSGSLSSMAASISPVFSRSSGGIHLMPRAS